MVSEAVRRKAIAEGPVCQRWLADLGELITRLERDWAMKVGVSLHGGSAAFVAEAVTADGTPAVIKLAMPAELEGRASLDAEVRTLLLADGRGCVRVLNHDVERGAVLLERLGRRLFQLGLPVSKQMRIICAVLKEVWSVPLGDASLLSLDEKGRWLAEFIATTSEELDHPCSRRAVELAISYAKRRSAAFDIEQAVLVHGDGHASNTLEDLAARRPGAFKLVDPDGLLAEPEYDLAIIMREFTDELLAGDALKLGRRRARFLAGHMGLDEIKIWEWGYVERVSTGLYCMKLGDAAAGRAFLRVAERWTGAPAGEGTMP